MIGLVQGIGIGGDALKTPSIRVNFSGTVTTVEAIMTLQEINDLCAEATEFRREGSFEDAERRFRWGKRAYEGVEEQMLKQGEETAPNRAVLNWSFAVTLSQYSDFLREVGRHEEAVPLLRDAIQRIDSAKEIIASSGGQLEAMREQIQSDLELVTEQDDRMVCIFEELDTMHPVAREAAMLLGRRTIQLLNPAQKFDFQTEIQRAFVLLYFDEPPDPTDANEEFNNFFVANAERVVRLSLEIAEVFPRHPQILR